MTTRIFGKFLSPIFKGLCVLSSILLVSCGGGGGGGTTAGGIGGTGSVASVGVANAVASVHVNGIDYSCAGATVISNTGNTDPSATDSCTRAQSSGQLRPGMVVVVVGEFEKSTGASKAITVTVQSNVAGPAVNFQPSLQTFTVLGQPIDVDETTRYFLNEIGRASCRERV